MHKYYQHIKVFNVLLDKLHLEQSQKRSAMAQQGVFCMQRSKQFIKPFNEFIWGPKNSRECNTTKQVSAAMMDAGAFLL